MRVTAWGWKELEAGISPLMPFHGELHLMKKYAAIYVLTAAGGGWAYAAGVWEKIRLDKCLCLRPTRVVCRDERSKKFAPEEIKGAQRRRRIVIQRRQKGQNLLWKKKRARQRANWPLDVFVVGFGQRPARHIYICAFSWAAASTSRHPTHNGPGAVYKSDSPACEIKVRARRENAAVGVSWVQCRCISNEPCACGERRFTLQCFIERAAPISPVYTTDWGSYKTWHATSAAPATRVLHSCDLQAEMMQANDVY